MSDVYDEVVTLAESMGVSIAFKNESKFMQTIGKILFFNKAFMAQFTTTIGSVVYFPNKAWLDGNRTSAALVLSHELTHVQDNRDEGNFRYRIGYLWPEIMVLAVPLALLAIWVGPACLFFLLGLAGLIPFKGSPGRAYTEYRGYATTMACMIWAGHPMAEPPDWIVQEFIGPSYFWMDPKKDRVRARLTEWIKIIKDDDTRHEPTLVRSLPMANRLKEIWTKYPIWDHLSKKSA